MKLTAEECDLVGRWVKERGHVSSDAVEKRIQWLIANALEKIGVANWTVLYRDPIDGRLWELTYPHGEMHGGGPMRLTIISAERAESKYPSAFERD